VVKDVLGQAVGVVSLALWLGSSVYFMARAAEPNVSDSGNWFAAFVVFTIVFIAIMAFWKRIFVEAH
jgi:hypothetical protein